MENNRFKGLDWAPFAQSNRILIGGAGGIGSWTALAMARAGFSIAIFDFDTVETTNLAGQFFKESDIGKKKTKAVSENVKMFTNRTIDSFDHRITKVVGDSNYNVYIAAFDNIEARILFASSWIEGKGKTLNNSIFIDPRLEAEFYYAHILTSEDSQEEINEYLEMLKEEKETLVTEGNCTTKQTSHIAMMCAGHITNLAACWVSNSLYEEEVKHIPKFIRFDGILNKMK